MCCDVLWLPGVTKGADTLAGVLQGSESCHLKFKLDTVQSATLDLEDYTIDLAENGLRTRQNDIPHASLEALSDLTKRQGNRDFLRLGASTGNIESGREFVLRSIFDLEIRMPASSAELKVGPNSPRECVVQRIWCAFGEERDCTVLSSEGIDVVG